MVVPPEPLDRVARLSAMDIRPAAESEAAALSELAMLAKSHWGYSTQALERWRAELAISPADVRERPTFAAVAGAGIAGFYSLRPSAGAWELDNLWVHPGFMHQGIGRALLAHALATAERGGASEVLVDADPNAESFYLAWGAALRGHVPAPIPGQPERVRPQLVFVKPAHALEAHRAP